MPILVAFTAGMIFLICGYSLGLGSMVSGVCAVGILFVGLLVYLLRGRPKDEPEADPGRAIN